jgi:hypothetical protein
MTRSESFAQRFKEVSVKIDTKNKFFISVSPVEMVLTPDEL